MQFAFGTLVLSFLCLLMTEAASKPDDKPAQKQEHVLSPEEDRFQQVFLAARMEQLNAVNQLRGVQSSTQLYKMVSIMSEKIFELMRHHWDTLMEDGFKPGIDGIPKRGPLQEAFLALLENTAVFCDMLVLVPHPTMRLLDVHLEWRVMLVDGIQFARDTELMDGLTLKQLDKANAMLSRYEIEVEEMKKLKKPKRKKLKRGPRLSTGSLTSEL